MIRRTCLSAIFLVITFFAQAQIYNPATWDFRSEKTGDKTYELVFTATIEEGSHIYSMEIPDGGPIPTSVRIDSSNAFRLEGKPFEAVKPEEVLDRKSVV